MNTEIESLYDRLGGEYLTPEEEATLWSTAVHEAAHSFVSVQLLGGDTAELVLATNGVCVHKNGEPLHVAAVSWAGIISESLFNCPHPSRTLPPFALNKSSLGKWIQTIRLCELSLEDREGIESHPNRYESARVAFEILSENLEVLEYLARRLAEKSRKDFVESTFKSAKENELVISKFVDEQKEAARAKAMEKKLQRAVVEGKQIIANLPPCRVPKEFDYQSFMDATGATDSEICAFCEFRILRERNQIGLGGVPDESLKTAIEFFRESAVATRDTWIQAARDFYKFRKGELRIL